MEKIEMRIRSVNSDDYESIARLYCQLHNFHVRKRSNYYKPTESVYSKADLENIISNDKKMIFVAVDDTDNTFGFIECEVRETTDSTILKNRKIIYLHALVTDVKHRRKGVAKELFNYIQVEGRKDNIDAIELNVWKFNDEAIKFYESLEMEIKNIRYEIEI
jgi:ribosomal protein S18 acetylase RimI-like enzyme